MVRSRFYTPRMPFVIGGGGGPIWNPADLGANASLWLEARNGTHLSTTNVDQWDDLGPNGFDMFADGLTRPTYGATSFGGGPGITFVPSDGDYMASELLPTGSGTPVGYDLNDEHFWFFSGIFDAGSNAYGRIFSYVGGAELAGSNADYAGSGNIAGLHRDSSNDGVQVTHATAGLCVHSITMGVPVKILSVFDGTSHNLYIDDPTTPIVTPIAHVADLGPTGSLALGGVLNPASGSLPTPSSAFFGGVMSMILIGNIPPDLAARQGMFDYADTV